MLSLSRKNLDIGGFRSFTSDGAETGRMKIVWLESVTVCVEKAVDDQATREIGFFKTL